MLRHLREYIDFNDIDTDETIENSPLTDKEFVKFLKDNNIYWKFINNLYVAMRENKWGYGTYWNSIETFCQDVNVHKYIARAFVWVKTPEGNDFWRYYNEKWEKLEI